MLQVSRLRSQNVSAAPKGIVTPRPGADLTMIRKGSSTPKASSEHARDKTKSGGDAKVWMSRGFHKEEYGREPVELEQRKSSPRQGAGNEPPGRISPKTGPELRKSLVGLEPVRKDDKVRKRDQERPTVVGRDFVPVQKPELVRPCPKVSTAPESRPVNYPGRGDAYQNKQRAPQLPQQKDGVETPRRLSRHSSGEF